MKNTFAEMGIPFPLYEAPVDASDFVGYRTCSLCGRSSSPCFSLGIGDNLMMSCSRCGSINGLDVDDKASAACRSCSTIIEFPPSIADLEEPVACYTCVRSGKAALTKDSEFGMVSWEQAVSGVTHGVPGLEQDQFESVMLDPEEDWIGARVSEEILLELLRTPGYCTWQGECWLFCCKYPMTFVGAGNQEDFRRRAPSEEGKKLFYETVMDVPPNSWKMLRHSISVYVFECKRCNRLRAHWDSD